MNDQNDNTRQEKAFHKALKSYGYIFPETEAELQSFEESISKMKFQIPDKFNDPMEILKAGKIENVGQFNSFNDVQIEEHLAQAAREGSNIPDDVRAQMEKDRKDAEEKSDGE
jgi:hypothetical protein